MQSDTNMLQIRVGTLETMFFGDSVLLDADQVAKKLKTIVSKLQFFNLEVPNIMCCMELMQKLQPSLVEKKIHLNQTKDKVDSLLLKRESLINLAKDLAIIKTLSATIDNTSFQELDLRELLKRVGDIEEQLTPLVVESKQQSQEVDDLLEVYEKTMQFVSDVCQGWDEKLKHLEQQRTAALATKQ